MSDEDLTRGRVKLDVAKYGADLSGKDFENVFLDSTQTLSHSFLNGTSFKTSTFLGAPLDQTELAEAEIQGCYFEKTEFVGSSFIGASVEDTIFRNCNFTDGEWRQSHFINVNFIVCHFNYTTVNLCTFDNCQFTGEDCKGLDNRSVNYNVFTQVVFDFLVEDDVVLASNFGLPSQGTKRSIANYGAGITLEEVCLKSSSGTIVVSEFVDAIETEFFREKSSRLKALRLEFISNIIRALAKHSKISATSLMYLENCFLTLAKSSSRESDALAAMSILLNIRSLLVNVFEHEGTESEYTECSCAAIEIQYKRTYDRSDAIELAEILGELSNNDPATFTVSKFTTGSTFIDLVPTQIVNVGATLLAINFVLKQANITLVQVRAIGKNLTNLLKPVFKKAKKPKRKHVSRVPALQRSGGSAKVVVSLRHTVTTHGYRVVMLDDTANVVVRYVSNK
jgi:uncharacterized protein YjbI with pentapeptide repeats